MTALAQPQPPRMTADEFIAWAMDRPNGGFARNYFMNTPLSGAASL